MTGGEPDQRARGDCLQWLARREHSRAELVHKLESRGYDVGLIGDTLDELKKQSLQSDRRFMESFVRSRFARGQGPLRIRQELRLHGVDLAELNECLAEYDWDALLARVHLKKFGNQRPSFGSDAASRVRFLVQRGFEPERVRALLRQLGRSDD